MKKLLLVFSAAVVSMALTAFTVTNWNPIPGTIDEKALRDFRYQVGSRFNATITKTDLDKAASVVDIVPPKADWGSFPIHTVKVTLWSEYMRPTEKGSDIMLTDAQLQLLQSTKYSDDIRLIASCKGRHKNVRKDEYDLTYFITVVPEREATYPGGEDVLIAHLRENSMKAISIVREDRLEPGMIYFTVTTMGTISDVELTGTSGYDAVDKKMVELITNMPGKWQPAENHMGLKVNQTFVLSFGKEGC